MRSPSSHIRVRLGLTTGHSSRPMSLYLQWQREIRMDYPLENLGPDRFQELCQSLLARLSPDIQCFPLHQADGGRDALLTPHGDLKQSIVFQVKFVENPQRHRAPQTYLSRIVRQEREKVAALASRGAAKYYLLTNVRGTGGLDSGSIDSMAKELNDNLPIPVQCWWRDDICRRLDAAWEVKFSFPEVLRSIDFMGLVASNATQQRDDRIAKTLQAFLQDQYERDREVRFNQVELHSEILDLFIDVPVDLTEQVQHSYRQANRRSPTNRLNQVFAQIVNQLSSRDPRDLEFDFDPMASFRTLIGAASLLLHPLAQRNDMQIVIEGAPGQGKSTVAQYVCQVHRHRLLQLPHTRLNSAHAATPLSLPLRIDCRDLGTWLGEGSPFKVDVDAARTNYLHRTTESFLSAQIADGSGGLSFSTNDLLVALSSLPVVLFFDGLDEVADVKRRREVVDAIEKGVARIRRNALSLQVVVTSRPAVFANSPGLPERTYPRLQLSAIETPAVMEYASLWLKAQKLPRREGEIIRGVLYSKLEQPHVRELARNPMQLSILLSLVRSHGVSLPDMRTTLYDRYVERSFSREAEKSPVVRDHRILFLQLHRYIAWVLHTEAETGQGGGRVEEARLKELIQGYLNAEGHDRIAVEQLLSGMVERVVALISRVEGTFEFEVQPLREYFAAKYLYLTAPHSSPGREGGGTKLERFDAIARNFFWQNVTRFYAGCYEQGEVPALVDSLSDLVAEEGYKDTSYPLLLASTLLSDWVFAQYPKSMKEVVSMILRGLDQHRVALGRQGYRDIVRLPRGCGDVEIVQCCLDLLEKEQPRDFAWTLLDIIAENSDVDGCLDQWQSRCDGLPAAGLTRWMEYGLQMGVLAKIPDIELGRLLDSEVVERSWLAVQASREQLVVCNERRAEAVVGLLLETAGHFVRWPSGLLATFASVLVPNRYMLAFSRRTSLPLSSLWSTYRAWEIDGDLGDTGDFQIGERCAQFIDTAASLAREHSCSDWSTTLDPWRALVSNGRSLFGEQWAWVNLANAAAGIKSTEIRGQDASRLLDRDLDLCDRVRYARLRGSAWRWWNRQLKECVGRDDVMLCLLVFFSWAGRAVFGRLSEVVDEMLRGLDVDDWQRLQAAIPTEGTRRYELEDRPLFIDIGKLPDALSPRFAVAVSPRVRHRGRIALYRRYVAGAFDDDRAILEFSQGLAVDVLGTNSKDWSSWLPVISDAYSRGVVAEDVLYRVERGREMPLTLAMEIAKQCDRYPMRLVEAAWNVVRDDVASRVTPLGRVAEEGRWLLAGVPNSAGTPLINV